MDLLLLLLALVLIAAVNGASSALRREHGRVRAVAANAGPGELGHYELAYLAGGPRRVVNTAIALMARAGALRVSRGGTLHLVASAFSADPSSGPSSTRSGPGQAASRPGWSATRSGPGRRWRICAITS